MRKEKEIGKVIKLKVCALTTILLIPAIFAAMCVSEALAAPSTVTQTYISDDTGSTLAKDDAINPGTGLPYYGPLDWVSARYAWGPNDGSGAFWNSYLNPAGSKTALLDSGANWIWKRTCTPGMSLPDGRTVYTITNEEAVTGDIVKFKRIFNIPSNAYNLKGTLLIATDNAFYMYVNKDFSGTPLLAGNFYNGYTYDNFRDPVTGFPIEGSVELPNSPPYPWSTIHSVDVSPELQTGDNALEIVGINEYSTPSNQGTPTSNPAGVIYKLVIEYELKVYLTVKTDPPGVTSIPGEGWYEICTSVDLTAPETVDVTSDTRYIFDHWDVDTIIEPGNPIKVHMDADHTATAHYVKQYYLDVVSPYDTPTGMGWYNESTNAYAELSYGIEDLGPGKRAVFDHWTGDASGTGLTSDAIYMDGPKTAVAVWNIEYYLTVRTDPEDITTIPGEDWYPYCTYVDLNAPEYVPVTEDIRYRFDYWDVDTISQGAGINPITVHMDAPHVATAHYVEQYYLTVKTDPEGLIPAPIGEGWYDRCTYVRLRAAAVACLDSVKYVFVYWDVDGDEIKDNPIEVHMDGPHVATACYQLPTPRNLDAEPPRMIDLKLPLSTQWLELHPEFGNGYRVDSWHDTNGNGMLDPSDLVGLWDTVLDKEAIPYWWHVDDITVTLKVSEKPALTESMYIELESGWANYTYAIVDPESTQWFEVYPSYDTQYFLEKWHDNCDGKLTPSDQIILRNKASQTQAEYHVDQVKTDIIISPRATEIKPCKIKGALGQGYPLVIPVRIESYNSETTTFEVSAYHDDQTIGGQPITLDPLETEIAVIKWMETATWPKGTYSFDITVIINFPDSTSIVFKFPITFKISIVGDIAGLNGLPDGQVNMKDVAAAAKAFGTRMCEARWNPNADVNNDFRIDIKDIALIVKNFGTVDP